MTKKKEGPLGDEETADVEVLTGLRARSLRFGVVPDVSVGFEGEPGERSSTESERENLPDEVEPGVTYRDVHVRWGAAARIVPPPELDEENDDSRAKG